MDIQVTAHEVIDYGIKNPTHYISYYDQGNGEITHDFSANEDSAAVLSFCLDQRFPCLEDEDAERIMQLLETDVIRCLCIVTEELRVQYPVVSISKADIMTALTLYGQELTFCILERVESLSENEMKDIADTVYDTYRAGEKQGGYWRHLHDASAFLLGSETEED